MDSLTQIVLGASVAEATLGKKIGNKAILYGAIAGTIPDLDIILKFFVDDLSATEMHRGFSHSLLFPFIIAPILGLFLKKIHQKLSNVSYLDWTKLFFFSIITHPILDAQTTWGTQLFWPLNYRIAADNIFIIDPLYTIPFLIFLIICSFQKNTSKKRKFYNNLGLIISSSYLVLTFVSKGIGLYNIQSALEKENIEYINLNTKPTFFNSILWAGQIETKDSYIFTYYSLFDKSNVVFSKAFTKNHQILNPIIKNKKIKQLINISNGNYIIEKKDQKIIFWNLKLGQGGFSKNASPLIWSYEITQNNNEILVSPGKSFRENRNYKEEFNEFLYRLRGI